jgi:hypothetical protein
MTYDAFVIPKDECRNMSNIFPFKGAILRLKTTKDKHKGTIKNLKKRSFDNNR